MVNTQNDIPILPSFDELFPKEEKLYEEDSIMNKVRECERHIADALKSHGCTIMPQVSFGLDAQGFLRYMYNLELVPIQLESKISS